MTSQGMLHLMTGFLSKVPRLPGKYESADGFFTALRVFLQSEEAMNAVREAWRDRRAADYEKRVKRTVAKVFEDDFLERCLRDIHGFRDAAHAARMVGAASDLARVSVEELDYEGFCKRPMEQRAIERAVTVASDAVDALAPTTRALLDKNLVLELGLLNGVLSRSGHWPDPVSLWRMATEVLPGLAARLDEKPASVVA